jgi:hypothetical protein
VLKSVLHDWDDERAQRIIENCHRAAAPGSRPLVVEPLLPEGPGASFTHLVDLNMLVQLGGRERTRTEYAALLASAGYHLEHVIPTDTPWSLLEAQRR